MSESPDLHPLFVQLQTRYPTSGLLTELVQIHADHCVVRAIVQLGNTMLATSLAAAITVEQAEDQARLRVLALVGIRPATLADLPAMADLSKMPFSNFGTPPSVTTQPITTQPITTQPITEAFQDTVLPPAIGRAGHESVTSKTDVSAAIVSPPPLPPTPSFEPPALTKAALPLIVYPSDVALEPIDAPDDEDEPFESESLEPESFEPQSFEFEPEPFEPESFEPESFESEPFESEPLVAKQEAANPSPDEPATTDQQAPKSKPRKPSTSKEVSAVETASSTSRDLSSLISQIGVEIDRIGWSKRQGSTYLQKTYGKKTRSELTDDELEDFLTYLNTQPAAGEGEG